MVVLRLVVGVSCGSTVVNLMPSSACFDLVVVWDVMNRMVVFASA